MTRASQSERSVKHPRRLIALLGQKDMPTDGVEDYCTFLGEALARRGIELKQVRVDWARHGWIGALRRLWRESKGWRDSWVLVQYTALSWSRHGFSFPALAVLAILRRRGALCAVVFHEPWRQGSPSRWIDLMRGACQDWMVRKLHRAAAKGIFTVPLDIVPWLAHYRATAAFIPIGANVPERYLAAKYCPGNGTEKTIAIFCLSLNESRLGEIEDLACAVRYVHEQGLPVRLLVLGKGSEEARQEIEKALAGTGVRISVRGLMTAEKVSATLCEATALLFVHGRVSQLRGSVLAGVACGLPIVGYSAPLADIITDEAGVELAPFRDKKALGAALLRVLSDDERQARLRAKNLEVQKKYFSWDVIADGYVEALSLQSSQLFT